MAALDRVGLLIDSMFEAYLGEGYLTYSAWAPGSSEKIAAVKSAFPQLVALKHVYYARSIPRQRMAHQILQLAIDFGGRDSGLWSIGLTTSPEDLSSRLDSAGMDAESPILATAAGLESVQAAICLDDALDMLFLKDRADAPTLVSRFVALVQ